MLTFIGLSVTNRQAILIPGKSGHSSRGKVDSLLSHRLSPERSSSCPGAPGSSIRRVTPLAGFRQNFPKSTQTALHFATPPRYLLCGDLRCGSTSAGSDPKPLHQPAFRCGEGEKLKEEGLCTASRARSATGNHAGLTAWPRDILSRRLQTRFDGSLLADSGGHGNLEHVDSTPKDDDAHHFVKGSHPFSCKFSPQTMRKLRKVQTQRGRAAIQNPSRKHEISLMSSCFVFSYFRAFVIRISENLRNMQRF